MDSLVDGSGEELGGVQSLAEASLKDDRKHMQQFFCPRRVPPFLCPLPSGSEGRGGRESLGPAGARCVCEVVTQPSAE